MRPSGDLWDVSWCFKNWLWINGQNLGQNPKKSQRFRSWSRHSNVIRDASTWLTWPGPIFERPILDLARSWLKSLKHRISHEVANHSASGVAIVGLWRLWLSGWSVCGSQIPTPSHGMPWRPQICRLGWSLLVPQGWIPQAKNGASPPF